MFGFLLDLEGVIVKDKSYEIFPQALQFTQELDKRRIPWIIITNNSTEKPGSLIKILKNKGLNINERKIITPLLSAVERLRKDGIKKLYILGTEDIKQFFKENNFEVREDHHVDAVVVGLDKSIDYRKLKIATSALTIAGANLYSFHLNKLTKDTDGLITLSVGAIAKALSYATDKEITSLGKPSKEYFESTLSLLKTREAYMVSDDPFSDLAGGKENMGFKTVFVLCGKYNNISVLNNIPENLKPDHIFKDISGCLKLI